MIFNPQPQKQEEEKVTITISGRGDPAKCYASISGNLYYAPTTVSVSPGTQVYCYALSDPGFTSLIRVAGLSITRPGGTPAEYTLTVDKNTKIQLAWSYQVNNQGILIFRAVIDITY